MKNKKFSLILFLFLFSKLTLATASEEEAKESNLTSSDWKALNNFIAEKTLLRRLEGIGGKITISGEIATQWTYRHETFENDIIVDNQPVTKSLENVFPTTFTLRLRYDSKKTWLSSQLQWKKAGGVPNTSALGIISRAFMGYQFYQTPKSNFYIEGGSSSLGLLFESAVQFGSNFSGAHFFYSQELGQKQGLGIIHGGPFVVNIVNKQYAWVVEGILNKLPGGLLFKYSMIDWHTFRGAAPSVTAAQWKKINAQPESQRAALIEAARAENKALLDQRFKFLVCQGLIGCERTIYKIPSYVYAVALFNPRAEASSTTLNKKANKAWYVGGTFGTLRKANDWSLTLRYEYVQALAIPEDDCSGIGSGTIINSKFYQAIIQKQLPAAADGFTNYQGFSFLGMYSLTDSISTRLSVNHSRPVEKNLGNPFKYNTVSISIVSAF